MIPSRILLLLAFAVGACAPAQPAATPTPQSAPPATAPATAEPAATGTPGTPSEPPAAEAPVPSAAPEQWWLGDTDAAAPGAGVRRAYRELLAGREPARTVVVGVIDSGVDIEHEDLDDNLWVNEDEVAGNGVDDDGNGYVDDVHGWNFIGGPDGRHVDQDTYEVTRLVAECRAAGGGGEREAMPGVACEEVESALEKRRRDAEQMLQQVRAMSMALDRSVDILRGELGTDSLSVEGVRSIVPMRRDVGQARQIYLQFAQMEITPEMMVEEEERLEGLLERGLNPEFNPRTIVGDDYADLDERVYGNPDVEGPRAGHGTGVAGIIAGERGNGIGEDGIAPSARIMVLRTVPNGDERDKDVANAIRYAADNGAHIVNMSFGKGYSPGKEAVDAAVRYAEERGVLLVHAAGNEAQDLTTERNFPNRFFGSGGEASTWIEVGASGWQGRERLAAQFSNYGRGHVDVFAPGVDIRTTDVGDAFQTNSGTSFAAPVVSGLAALIMAYYPELDAATVRRVILESARPYGAAVVARPGAEGGTVAFGELSTTGGVVDAYAALRMAERLAGEATRAGS